MRHHIICFLFACLITCIAVLSDYRGTEGYIETEAYDDYAVPESAYSIIDEVNQRLKNSRMQGRTVEPTASDAQLYFRFYAGGEKSFRSVAVYLEEGLYHEADAVLYYPNEDGEYEKNNYVKFTLPKGKKVVYFNLPEDVDYAMTEIRLDLDEEYEIADLKISVDEITQVHALQKCFWPPAVYFAAWFAAGELVAWILRGKGYSLGKILDSVGKKRKFALEHVRKCVFLAAITVLVNLILQLLFRVSGKEWSFYWTCLITLCSLLCGYQLLLLGFPGILCGRKGFVTGNAGQSRCNGSAAGNVGTVCRNGVSGISGDALRRLIFWGFVLIFLGLIAFEWYDGALDAPKRALKIRFWFPYVFALIETVFLALLYRKYMIHTPEGGISFYRAYLWLVFLFGLGYMLLFLPYVSADEPSHYVSAYRISNLFLGKFSQFTDDQLLMRVEDYQFFDGRRSLRRST